MTQSLILSSSPLQVASTASVDKAAASSGTEGGLFAEQLSHKMNGTQRPANDKQADESRNKPTAKAEETAAKDGKNLPATAAAETDAATKDAPSSTAGDADTELAMESQPVADELLINASQQQLMSEQTIKTQKTPVSVAVIQHPVVATLQNKSVATDDSKTNPIRADILQALQPQKGEDGSLVTEKVKSMLQITNKGLQQAQAVSAETVGSVRQFEPLTDTVHAGRTPTAAVMTTIPSSAALSLDIQPQLNSEAWNKVVSSRVVWMAREGVQHAELRLTPAHLGPVEVRLSLQNEQASVTFTAANAAARDALEQALPRLRDSFTENGLELNHAEVNHQDASAGEGGQEQLFQDEHNQTQVIVELDANDDGDGALLNDELTERSAGLSVFA